MGTVKAGHALQRYAKIFKGKLPAVIAMVHVKALPGTPGYRNQDLSSIIEQACTEANIYKASGVDGILLENMHDIPYMNRNVGPEIVAAMTAICYAVKNEVGTIPCGIQILAGCNTEAIAAAKACNLDFIRAEGFVFSHVADEGIINSDAGHLLRYRKAIDAEHVMVFTDVKKKHSSHSITNDLDICEVARGAEFFLSDGAIITGSHTGDPAKKDHIKSLKENQVTIPILVGSGVSNVNLSDFIDADGLIVGSHFKKDGNWRNMVDRERVFLFMEKVANLRQSAR